MKIYSNNIARSEIDLELLLGRKTKEGWKPIIVNPFFNKENTLVDGEVYKIERLHFVVIFEKHEQKKTH